MIHRNENWQRAPSYGVCRMACNSSDARPGQIPNRDLPYRRTEKRHQACLGVHFFHVPRQTAFHALQWWPPFHVVQRVVRVHGHAHTAFGMLSSQLTQQIVSLKYKQKYSATSTPRQLNNIFNYILVQRTLSRSGRMVN